MSSAVLASSSPTTAAATATANEPTSTSRLCTNNAAEASDKLQFARPKISLYKPLAFCLIPLYLTVTGCTFNTPWFSYTVICCVVASVGFIATFALIPVFASIFIKKGLVGKDLNKPGAEIMIPESLGLVPATIFILCSLFSQLLFSNDPVKLLEYNSGLVAVTLMTFLGFVDDIVDLLWRYKLIMPVAAALPLIISYQGGSSILFPPFLRPFIPSYDDGLLDLGYFYYIYMGLLTVFCTNSINIYAGINGLEVGQTLVICSAVIVNNLINLHSCLRVVNAYETSAVLSSSLSTAAALSTKQFLLEDARLKLDQHFFSLLLSLPFFSCSFALFCFNWYPSSVFVGDTYTYFAGVYFAVVGILGHSSKTLLLLFIPQIINFILSIPQLLGLVRCPRHRIPRINKETGFLESSKNLTFINLVLEITGPLKENHLCKLLLLFQAFTCTLGLVAYHSVFRVK